MEKMSVERSAIGWLHTLTPTPVVMAPLLTLGLGEGGEHSDELDTLKCVTTVAR